MNTFDRGALDTIFASTALGVARAREAAAWVFGRRRWDANPSLHLRCGRCGLNILGARGIVKRAAAHAASCPGGVRGDDVWLPLVHRADQPPASLAPVLRLVRGNAAARSEDRMAVDPGTCHRPERGR